MFNPRSEQAEVISYTKGLMGVSAVPGSGKTHTLSYLAAKLIAEGNMFDDQEILIVTLVNSAVENFSQRIRGFLAERKLLTDLGYRVRTLHGLAHDIIRERPDSVGLDTQFSIIDESEQESIIRSLAQVWDKNHPEFKDLYIKREKEGKLLSRNWIDFLVNLGITFIKTCKDFEKVPREISALYEKVPGNTLLELGIDLYKNYQEMLTIRGAVDFSDLIRLAIIALENDNLYLKRLQNRWPYVLEDEAQDSSQLQQKMLSLLTQSHGNWVRVGDPNQAIYETFTTANPKFLVDFMQRSEVRKNTLPVSGRSTKSIISLANELIRWTITSLDSEQLRSALCPPYIKATPQNDPQPNPPDEPNAVLLYKNKLTEQKEIDLITNSVKKWVTQNPDKTIAVLAPRNTRAGKIAEALQSAGVDTQELLQTTQSTRQVAKKLLVYLRFINDPTERNFLPLCGSYFEQFSDKNLRDQANQFFNAALKNLSLEDVLFSKIGLPKKFFVNTAPHPFLFDSIENFYLKINRWQQAALLPIDQLILIISQDIFNDPADLAVSFKIAVLLERGKQVHPEWQIDNFCLEIQRISDNNVRLSGFTEADTGFDPDEYKGKAVVATMHKAKGLEWDRVYLVSVNNYDFPLAQSFDRYQGETWFIRDELNLQAEMLSLLHWLINKNDQEMPSFGEATTNARLQYAAERLRLLYVGITRARRELVITWNSGRDYAPTANQAAAFNALCSFWEQKHVSA